MNFDFSFFLFSVALITGIIWGVYLLYLKYHHTKYIETHQPLIVEYARSFFPVILIVFILRSFIFEPFMIPSGSMMPTLLIGDFILVNKFTYGIRLPIINKKIIDINKPKRGDAVVFRNPKNPSVNYIKRVIGLPGEHIVYKDKKLIINNIARKQVSLGRYQGIGRGKTMSTGFEILSEDLLTVEHNILISPFAPNISGSFIVPKGQYFVLGDNRDNSNDSRYWGTVPEENLVGRAVFIWMSWDWKDWKNTGIMFNRIGTLIQ